MLFAEKLKALRKQKGISQEGLAEKLYVSRQAITKWESGNGIPDIENLIAISALFNESLDSLLSEEKMSFILQHGTELGITEFVVVQYEHCKYKLKSSDYDKKLQRWNKIIKEASEQSYRIHKPILNKIIAFKDIEGKCNVNILCSLDKEGVKSICKVLTTDNCSDTISLVFGPEGGLSKNEEKMIEEKGFTKTSLGSDVLRTETVPLMVASIVKYLKESVHYEQSR